MRPHRLVAELGAVPGGAEDRHAAHGSIISQPAAPRCFRASPGGAGPRGARMPRRNFEKRLPSLGRESRISGFKGQPSGGPERHRLARRARRRPFERGRRALAIGGRAARRAQQRQVELGAEVGGVERERPLVSALGFRRTSLRLDRDRQGVVRRSRGGRELDGLASPALGDGEAAFGERQRREVQARRGVAREERGERLPVSARSLGAAELEARVGACTDRRGARCRTFGDAGEESLRFVAPFAAGEKLRQGELEAQARVRVGRSSEADRSSASSARRANALSGSAARTSRSASCAWSISPAARCLSSSRNCSCTATMSRGSTRSRSGVPLATPSGER